MTSTLLERDNVAKVDQWNVEALYPTFQDWQKDFNSAATQKETPKWPELQKFKGRLHESPEVLVQYIQQLLSLSRKLSKLFTYAHLRHDEDITRTEYKQALMGITALLHAMGEENAWFEPELLDLPEDKIQQVLASPALADYRFFVEKIVRLREHTLPHEQEELLAQAGKALEASHKAFSAINDADFKFGKIIDEKGVERDLTHGSYALFMRSQDRPLRERAFRQLFSKYKDYENTLCELLNGEVQAHLFYARARKYSSCLEAALYPKNIDPSVYHALIKAVHNKIPSLHRYMALRKKILGVKELHYYDLYVPLMAEIDMKMDYKEGEKNVIEAVKTLGVEYQDTLRKGLETERWVDRFENKNKRSGAYSSGCFDSMPYILMNYKNLLNDVFTLAHEAGHSMHSLLSRQHQPYHYADYPIFLAEVASTFNEELLMRLLVDKAKTKEEKIYLINQKIEDIRGTLFRQTMFAEFELAIHEMAEKDIPITPAHLRETYTKLNAFYYGDSLVLDSEVGVEWARIPHFYYDFYVYQYATGISAALALADKVVSGSTADQEAYLRYLKAGSSRFPLDTLKLAGVDMRSPSPVEAAIHKFDQLVDELEKLMT